MPEIESWVEQYYKYVENGSGDFVLFALLEKPNFSQESRKGKERREKWSWERRKKEERPLLDDEFGLSYKIMKLLSHTLYPYKANWTHA